MEKLICDVCDKPIEGQEAVLFEGIATCIKCWDYYEEVCGSEGGDDEVY